MVKIYTSSKFTHVRLLQETERIFLNFPKYRQRLTSMGRMFHGPRFEDDPQFKSRNHISITKLPEPARKKDLEALVNSRIALVCSGLIQIKMGSFVAQEWDLTKPLWEMVIVENYSDDQGAECALLVRGCAIVLSFELRHTQCIANS